MEFSFEVERKNAIELYQSGENEAAKGLFQEIIRRNPTDGMAIYFLTGILFSQSELDDAWAIIKPFPIKLWRAGHYHLAGKMYSAEQRFGKAINCFKTALNLNPKKFKVYSDLAHAFYKQGDLTNAKANSEQAYSFQPDSLSTNFQLGFLSLETNDLSKATSLLQKALSISPGHIKSTIKLGEIAKKRNNVSESLEIFLTLASNNPDHSDAHRVLGTALEDNRKYYDAIVSYDKAIALDATNYTAYFNRTHARLITGDDIGFLDYEYRSKIRSIKPRLEKLVSNITQWKGENSEHLLIYIDQGIGDAIFFFRWIQSLVSDVNKITLICNPSLVSLFSQHSFLSCVSETNLPKLNYNKFDYCIAVESIPAILIGKNRPLKIEPHYICSDKEHAAIWRNQIESNFFNVGLVWAGNPVNTLDYRRSLSLDILKPIFDVKDVKFHSLQVGDRSKDVQQCGISDALIDHNSSLTNFEITAGLIEVLDLIITVDTSVAHLAGAMNKNAWVLLSYNPHWVYTSGSDRCKWYPNMKMFKQKKPAEWEQVINEVAHCLSTHTKL